MPYWRVAILSLIGFSAPILLALIVAPMFRSDHLDEVKNRYQRARLDPSSDEVDLPEELPHPLAPASFQEISKAKSIDPGRAQAFVASAMVRFSKLPEVGKRERLFFKYAITQKPYAGWALAVRRWPGSLRPEVYWRDSQGNGGWYTFGDVALKEGIWYRFTFIVEENEALSMFVATESNSSEERSFSKAFVGGVAVDDVQPPQSGDSLFVPPLIAPTAPGSHAVESSEFLIAELSAERLAQLKKRLSRSGAVFRSELKEDELRLLLEPTEDRQQVALQF